MLCANDPKSLKRRILALYCIGALVFPACASRRAPSSHPVAPMMKSAKPGRNAYHSAKPEDLSQYIRGVFQAYGEDYNKDRDRLRPATTTADSIETNPEVANLSAQLAESPDDPKLTRSLADLHLAEGRLLEALDLYSRLERRFPDDRQIQRALATIWDAWRNYPQALEHAARALSPSEMTAADWLFLGRIHLRGENLTAAGAALRKSVEMEPGNGAALVELGNACFRLTDWSAAVRHLKEALRLDGRLDSARRKLALSLAHLQRDEQALQEFMVLETAARAHNDLGLVQLADRRWETASRSFAAALSVDPRFEEAQANLARTEAYRPLAASVTLPSFDLAALPAGRVEFDASRTGKEPGAEPSADPDPNVPARTAFVLELDGGQSNVAGATRLSEPESHALPPSPIPVVEHVGNIQAVVELREFTTPVSNDTTAESRWREADEGMETRFDAAQRDGPQVSHGASPLSAAWQPTVVEVSSVKRVPEVPLSVALPVSPLPANQLAAPSGSGWSVPTVAVGAVPGTSLQPTENDAALPLTLWGPLEGTGPSIRFPVGVGPDKPAGDREGDLFRREVPAWELRPIPPNAATIALDTKGGRPSQAPTAILDTLGKMAQLALPESIKIAPLPSELPAIRPTTLGEVSVVVGSSPPSQPALLTARPPNREETLRLTVSPQSPPFIQANWVAPRHLSLISPLDANVFRSAVANPLDPPRRMTTASTVALKPPALSSRRAGAAKRPSEVAVSVSAARLPEKDGEAGPISSRSRWSRQSFPGHFAQIPMSGEARRGSISAARQPATPRASDWRLAFRIAVGVGLVASALACFLGLGALATVLIGALVGLAGATLTLSHAGDAGSQARIVPPQNRKSA